MNVLNLIGDFKTIDIIILVLIVFIFILLLFLTNSLMKKNRQLRRELNRMSINDNIDVEAQSEEEKLNSQEEIPLKEEMELLEEREEENIDEILGTLPEIAETGPYKKNVLRELSARGQTSPVNIGKSTVDVPKVKVTSYVVNKDIKIPKSTTRELKIDKGINSSNVDNKTFIEEISKRMEEEIKPQTIELTEYEKKQEEEAIISYKELIKAKDRIYRINDEEEIDTFIDELKEFRTNLE